MYDKGKGVPQEYNNAMKFYTRAAEQANTDAQFSFGVMYHRGAGVLQHNLYAHMWLDTSASLRNENTSEINATIAKRMTPTYISKARQLARECVAKDFKGC